MFYGFNRINIHSGVHLNNGKSYEMDSYTCYKGSKVIQ